MKKVNAFLFIFAILSILISCVPKSQYDALMMENEKLKAENEIFINGEERTIAIIDNAYNEKDYSLAKESIEKLKKYHPESKSIVRINKLIEQIKKEEEKIRIQKEIEEKERIRKENYNNTGNWYVLSGYYIEYSNVIKGTFSNSATEDSLLNVKIKINKNKTISFQVFEYGSNNPVKATSISPDRYHVFYIYNSGGEQKYGSASGMNKSNEIVVNKEESAQILSLFKANVNIEFWISGTEYNENTKYKFVLDNIEWFENALRKLDES